LGRSRLSRKEADRLIAGQDPAGVSRIVFDQSMDEQSSRYALILEARKKRGEIKSFQYEAHVLVLSRKFNVAYKPDFVVFLPNGEVEYHECKVRPSSPGLVKTYWAAEIYSGHAWVIATPRRCNKKKKNPSFDIKRFEAVPNGFKHIHREDHEDGDESKKGYSRRTKPRVD